VYQGKFGTGNTIDIHVGTKAAPFINNCAERFDEVLYLYGNHEFYDHDLLAVQHQMPLLVQDNVTILDNHSTIINGINFIGSTLWADVEPGAFLSMNDSCLIENDGQPLSLQEVHQMFHENLEFIHSQVLDDMKNVVITHHAPSMDMINLSRYGEGVINTGYATDVIDQFSPDDIALWICGHTHGCKDITINGIRCVSNCRGYVGLGEVAGFDPNKVIEV
jgi:hypothetical protein